MEGHISQSVIDRLPATIRSLNSSCQQIYIYLRLRKIEYEIARLLNLSENETHKKINTIKAALIRAGKPE